MRKGKVGGGGGGYEKRDREMEECGGKRRTGERREEKVGVRKGKVSGREDAVEKESEK